MSSRIFSVGVSLFLAACGGPPDGVAPREGNGVAADSGTPADEPAERIACAVGNAALTNDCTVERVATADGAVLTIRHPDGGFRRLRVLTDGQVAAADGASPVRVVNRNDAGTEVAIGDARYRLPPTR